MEGFEVKFLVTEKDNSQIKKCSSDNSFLHRSLTRRHNFDSNQIDNKNKSFKFHIISNSPDIYFLTQVNCWHIIR